MAARIKFKDLEPPRLMAEEDVAHYLGIAPSFLSTIRDKLETLGFPRRDPVLQRRDRRLIDRWLDLRGGLIDRSAAPPEIDDTGAIVRQRIANLRKNAVTSQ